MGGGRAHITIGLLSLRTRALVHNTYISGSPIYQAKKNSVGKLNDRPIHSFKSVEFSAHSTPWLTHTDMYQKKGTTVNRYDYVVDWVGNRARPRASSIRMLHSFSRHELTVGKKWLTFSREKNKGKNRSGEEGGGSSLRDPGPHVRLCRGRETKEVRR